MSARLVKLGAVKARWQTQLRGLEKHLAIATQTLADLDAHIAQLEQLRLDYRMGRSRSERQGAAQLALLARFDVDLSQSLARIAGQREVAVQQLETRQAHVEAHQRKLLGLDRYQQSLQEQNQQEAKMRYRRRLNQVPWREPASSFSLPMSGSGENSDL